MGYGKQQIQQIKGVQMMKNSKEDKDLFIKILEILLESKGDKPIGK